MMIKKTFFAGLISVLFFSTVFSTASGEVTSTNDTGAPQTELQAKIQEKTQQLQEINNQLKEAEKKFSQTQSQRQTLQKQVTTFQNTINQLTLNIKNDAVSIQKLALEVDSLNYDLKDIQSSMEDKKAAITKLLVEIQKSDYENSNLLALFLKNKTLADGVMETQSLTNLRNQLDTDIRNLSGLSDEYNSKIQEKSGKISDIELHKNNSTYRKSIISSQKEEQQTLLTQTRNQETIYQKQLSEIQELQDRIEAEIEMMDKELRENIDPSLLPASGPDVLLNPVPKSTSLSQGYGQTNFALRTYRGKWHNGIDLAAPVGTEVFAADDGTVINVGNQDRYCPRAAYGKFVVIKHNKGLTTLYAHMSLQVVSIGQKVSRGQLIGYVGRTGWATGPHTHFTVFATQTITPARPGYPEGTKPSSSCGPMPVGGDLNPLFYTTVKK